MDILNYGISSHKRRIGFILSLLSWYLDQFGPAEHSMRLGDYLNLKSVDPQTDKTVKWEIDHIAANALIDDRISDDAKQGLGNLVLLNYKKNRGAGNSAPVTKKESYTVMSSLVLTKVTDFPTLQTYQKDLKSLAALKIALDNPWDLNNWTEVSIRNRMLFLKKLLQEFLVR